jgi:hypothetical protein
MNDAQQNRVVKGFRQERDRTIAQGTRSHLRIAMRRDENDRYSGSFRFKLSSELEARHAWHANVGNQAFDTMPCYGIEKLFRRAEAEGQHTIRLNQILQRAFYGIVVIDDSYRP